MTRRGGRHGVVPIAACAALLAGVLVPCSAASFAGRGANPGNFYALTALYAPSSLGATVAGHDVNLTWGARSNGNGYAVLGVNNGTSSDCSSASYANVGTASGTSYADTGRSAPQGTWFCYQVQTSYGSWTSVSSNPTAVAQIGVVATAVSASNGGTAGKLDPGDTITITFNQPISTGTGPSGTNSVCAINGTTIMLGSTTNGACSTSETVNLGTLSGGSSSRSARWNATYAWSNGNTTLAITIGSRTNGSQNPSLSGTWTLDPTTTTTKLLSATGSYHACDTNSGGGNCLPTLSGSF
jgi:hypothetical protein